ncbi:uncharacterized protein LOC129577989 [Sitodiplosis mosellana]|uniref:uncharacterized protein LOC129577989 n=1 Tax=Sitodiplosis mosellana TaxID=263140 RepID=UPI0024453796|nr:uncharacterized protein LOC129577989 [Sitodiplosis mosellana]
MALDLSMDLLKQTDHLLDATIKNIEPVFLQPTSPTNRSGANRSGEQSPAPSDSPKLKRAKHIFSKTTSTPLTKKICNFNLGVGTFVATCQSEVIKNFETNDNSKIERLRRLKRSLQNVLYELSDTDSEYGEKERNELSNQSFANLPTAKVLLHVSEEERNVIKVMRKCDGVKKRHFVCG